METITEALVRYNGRVVRNRLHLLLAQKAEKEKRKRYTVREVADATKLNKDAIADYMANKVRRFDASTIEALCVWGGWTVGDLLVIEADDTPRPDDSAQGGTSDV